MKQKLAFVLAAFLLLSSVLCACAQTAPAAPEASSEESAASAEKTAASAEEPASAPAEEAKTEGKQLPVQIGSDPDTLDPALNSTIDCGNMILHLFECLVTFDQDGELIPGCAESWETSEDGLIWTFHLREGLQWSDGSALTADDFVYSWKRVADPATESPYGETVLLPVKGYAEAAAGDVDALCVSAPDARTFVVELSAPCTYFGSLAAFSTLSPVQKATVEANGNDWANSSETFISNGPFRISEWVPGSHIVTEKNPEYRDADAIKLGSIKWLLIGDAKDAYDAYQRGEALFVKSVPSEEIPHLLSTMEARVEPIIGTYYLTVNSAAEPLSDPAVRKALSLAIDRQYAADTVMEGFYTPAWNYVGPGWLDPKGGDFMKNANGGTPYIGEDYAANLAEARALMQQAGYAGDPAKPDLQITYSTNDSSYHAALAEYLRQAWAQIGVELNINIIELSDYFSMRSDGSFEICRGGWIGDYSDPSSFLDLLYSANVLNEGRYSSAEYDADLELARTTLDPTVRSQALHDAEGIMMEEAACIPVVYYNDFWMQSTRIRGMWHTATGYWNFIYADVLD